MADSQPAGKPPQSYRLSDVTISLTRHPGNATVPVRRIVISGAGSARLESGDRTAPFPLAAEKTLALLNEFHSVRFFDLPADYTIRYSVFLTDDGSVGIQARRMHDIANTKVCAGIGAYEKCVVYGSRVDRTASKLSCSACSPKPNA